MDWMNTFPTLGRESLRALKKTIDSGFRDFTREWGESIENLFEPLKAFLIFCERLLSTSPWWAVLSVILLMIWWATRSGRIVVGAAISFLLMGYLGMWEDTMSTVSIIVVSTLVCIGLGLPIGILMSRSDRAQSIVTPILDVMQTIPSFVYLIPVVMMLGTGKVPGLISVVIYALPPMIRLTNLGIRLVDKEVLEAADAFGASAWQKLWQVQVPLALPNIFAGVNQTIMMSLAMVVIASMIGVTGLGQPVLKAISNQYLAMGLLNGLAIVALAIIFDRISQSYGKRLQSYRGDRNE